MVLLLQLIHQYTNTPIPRDIDHPIGKHHHQLSGARIPQPPVFSILDLHSLLKDHPTTHNLLLYICICFNILCPMPSTSLSTQTMALKKYTHLKAGYTLHDSNVVNDVLWSWQHRNRAYTPCRVYPWSGMMSWCRTAQSHDIVDNIMRLSSMYSRPNDIVPDCRSAHIVHTQYTMRTSWRYDSPHNDKSSNTSCSVYPAEDSALGTNDHLLPTKCRGKRTCSGHQCVTSPSVLYSVMSSPRQLSKPT